MLNETWTLVILLCAGVIGAVLRSYLGWNNTGEAFDKKAFLKTTIPAILVAVSAIMMFDFTTLAVSSLKNQLSMIILVLLGSAGFGSLQSKFI